MLCCIGQGFSSRLHPAMVNSGAWSGVRKGAWSQEEDNLLRKCIQKYGEGKWHLIPIRAGLNRCRKSCRLRWLNYLRPDIKRGDFSMDEVDLILRLHKLLGNRWSLIAGRIPGRTANDVKNYWNTHLQKKAYAMASSRQENWAAGKAPQITENIVVRPRPRRFLNTMTSSSPTSFTGKATTVACDAQLRGHTAPQPEATTPHLLKENNVQQNNSNSSLPSETTSSHDIVQWWKDLLSDEEGTTCMHQGQIRWTNFPTDMDLLELLS